MNRGFTALISVLIIAGALLAVVFANQDSVVQIFDMALMKSYRIDATNNALTCLNYAVTELAHDSFYTISKNAAPIVYEKEKCSIVYVSVPIVTSPSLLKDRYIEVSGDSVGAHQKISAYIDAHILLSLANISLVSATTTF
jgi:hypothetical protein